MQKVFNKILSIFMRAEILGIDRLDNGAILLGRVPHVAPLARLHVLFKGLESKDLLYIEQEIGQEIADQYREFLQLSNGLNIFSGSLSLNGYRKNYKREGDDAWQPFDFIAANTYEHPVDAYKHWMVIGGYKFDGSILYIDKKTGKVYRSEHRKAKNRLNEWLNFWTMLESETNRLVCLFDERGRKIDEKQVTTPDIQSNIEPVE